MPGPAAIDDVVGGFLYALSVDDPHGAVSTTISLNPVEILDGQHEYVTVTLVYGTGIPGVMPPEGPEGPDQPTLPPGSPEPPSGPDLNGGASGTDLAITHQVTPARLRAGGIVKSVTVVRNLGSQAATGVVAREIPQFHPKQANSVAHVLSLSTTAGKCTQRRPVRCELGTLAPDAKVTIRTHTKVLVARALRSVVVVSSNTTETNTANNIAVADVLATSPKQSIHAAISAPPTGRAARRLTYRVTVVGGHPSGAEPCASAPGRQAASSRCARLGRSGSGASTAATTAGWDAGNRRRSSSTDRRRRPAICVLSRAPLRSAYRGRRGSRLTSSSARRSPARLRCASMLAAVARSRTRPADQGPAGLAEQRVHRFCEQLGVPIHVVIGRRRRHQRHVVKRRDQHAAVRHVQMQVVL